MDSTVKSNVSPFVSNQPDPTDIWEVVSSKAKPVHHNSFTPAKASSLTAALRTQASFGSNDASPHACHSPYASNSHFSPIPVAPLNPASVLQAVSLQSHITSNRSSSSTLQASVDRSSQLKIGRFSDMAGLSGSQQHPDDGLSFGELLGELPSSTAHSAAAQAAPDNQQPLHPGDDDGSELQDFRSTTKDSMPGDLAEAFAAMSTAHQQHPISSFPSANPQSPTPRQDDAASQQQAAGNGHTAPSANSDAPSVSASTSPRKSGAEQLPKLTLQPDAAVPTLIESPAAAAAAAEDALEQFQLGSASDGDTELPDPRVAAAQRSASNVIRAAAAAERSADASGRTTMELSDSEQQQQQEDPFKPAVSIHGFGSTPTFGTATSGEAYGDAEEDGVELDSWPAARAGAGAAAASARQEEGEEMASWPAARASAGAGAGAAARAASAAAQQEEGEEMASWPAARAAAGAAAAQQAEGEEMASWPAARAAASGAAGAAAAQQAEGEDMASWSAARAAAGAHAAQAAAATQAEGEEMELKDFMSARAAAEQAAAGSSPQPSTQPAPAAAPEPLQRQQPQQQHTPPTATPSTTARISPLPPAAAPATASAASAAAGNLLQGQQPTSWRDHSRHYLILNSAGRPIWSLHGDEQVQAGLTALIQALVSVAQAQGDSLRSITAGATKVVLLVRGPIYLVAASRCGEPAAALQRQLHLLHSQLLFVVSSSVERALERNPGFDVQALLGSGSETLRRLVSEPLARSPGYLLEALEPLAMAPVDRRAAAEGLQEAVRSSGALYGALLVGSRLIALGNAPDLPQLHPLDLLLLATFVESTHSLRVGECFTPICLPHWQPKGIVHTYFKYLSGEPGLCLVLCGNGPDSFFGLSEARAVLETRLHDAGVLQRLRDSWAQRGQGRLLLEALPKPAGGSFGCTPLLHFVFKYPGRRQFVMPAFGEAHASRQQQQELMASYSQLYCAMHAAGDVLLADQQHGGGPGLPLLQLPRPQRMHWLATEQQVMVAYVDREYEIYAVLDPLADKETVTHVCDVLRKHLGSKAKQAELLLLAPSVLSPLQQQLAAP